MPSFAEGLGVPVLEAAAAGCRLVLSDLPALREIAPPDATFLDPLDGVGWRAAVLGAL
jgi:glycosyltransferase involved in cell wall biosynthesis